MLTSLFKRWLWTFCLLFPFQSSKDTSKVYHNEFNNYSPWQKYIFVWWLFINNVLFELNWKKYINNLCLSPNIAKIRLRGDGAIYAWVYPSTFHSLCLKYRVTMRVNSQNCHTCIKMMIASFKIAIKENILLQISLDGPMLLNISKAYNY